MLVAKLNFKHTSTVLYLFIKKCRTVMTHFLFFVAVDVLVVMAPFYSLLLLWSEC